MGGLLFLVVMAAFFYVFLVRPQQRRVKQHDSLVSSLNVGDEVVTAGGIVGNVTRINDRDVMLEVAPGIELRVVKGAIAQKKPEEAEKSQ